LGFTLVSFFRCSAYGLVRGASAPVTASDMGLPFVCAFFLAFPVYRALSFPPAPTGFRKTFIFAFAGVQFLFRSFFFLAPPFSISMGRTEGRPLAAPLYLVSFVASGLVSRQFRPVPPSVWNFSWVYRNFLLTPFLRFLLFCAIFLCCVFRCWSPVPFTPLGSIVFYFPRSLVGTSLPLILCGPLHFAYSSRSPSGPNGISAPFPCAPL